MSLAVGGIVFIHDLPLPVGSTAANRPPLTSTAGDAGNVPPPADGRRDAARQHLHVGGGAGAASGLPPARGLPDANELPPAGDSGVASDERYPAAVRRQVAEQPLRAGGGAKGGDRSAPSSAHLSAANELSAWGGTPMPVDK